MKITPAGLADRLAKGSEDSIFIVTGEQDLLRGLSLTRIQDTVVGEQANAFNFERFDGEETEIDRIVDAANMMPMLGGRRLLVVRRALRYIENPRSKSSDVKKGSPGEKFLAYAENPSPHSVLALELQKKPDGRRKAWKRLEKLAIVVQCDTPKAPEVASFIQEQARERQLKLGRDGVAYLMELFGSDLRRLVNELEKLALYSDGERVELEMLAELLGRGKAQSIFQFTDAVAERDSRRAIEVLDRLIAEGEPPLRILALLDRLVSQLRVAKAHKDSGRGSSLARVLGVPPFVASKLGQQSRVFPEAVLRSAQAELSNLDRRLKSSSVPGRLALESFVLSLCR